MARRPPPKSAVLRLNVQFTRLVEDSPPPSCSHSTAPPPPLCAVFPLKTQLKKRGTHAIDPPPMTDTAPPYPSSATLRSKRQLKTAGAELPKIAIAPPRLSPPPIA